MRTLERMASISILGVFILFSIAAAPPSKKSQPKDMVVAGDSMKFQQVMPGISKYTLWGDPAKGPYGSITRFTKGTKVAWHTHPHDIKAVVIKGTLLYDNGSGEKRLGPGSFLQERASIKHTTAASADSDLEFFEEGAGRFAVKAVK